jgi:hypothetical protein
LFAVSESGIASINDFRISQRVGASGGARPGSCGLRMNRLPVAAVLGLALLILFAGLRLAAFVVALRRVVVERFALGIVGILVGGALAFASLLPATAAYLMPPAVSASAVVITSVVPIAVAWRTGHHAPAGSDAEAGAGRTVRDVLPLALLDLARFIIIGFATWLLAD